MPAKASIAAGFLFSSRWVSAEGRLESATAAFICAVGGAAKAVDANKTAPDNSKTVRLIMSYLPVLLVGPKSWPEPYTKIMALGLVL